MKYDARACKYNMDTGCVELLLRDGRKISIDCTGVEDALDVTMAQRTQRRLDTIDRKGLNEPQRNYQRKKKLAEEFLRPQPAPYNDIILYN